VELVDGTTAPNNTPIASTPTQSLVDPEASEEGTTQMAEVQAKLDALNVDGDDADDDDDDGDDMPEIPPIVIKRLEAIQVLHEERSTIEEQYRKERIELEKKYSDLYAPILEKRHCIVSGIDSETKGETEDEIAVVGVPEFWLEAMKNHPVVAENITEADCRALEHLQDIRVETLPELTGFKLIFEFGPNECFSNSVLEKAYEIVNMMDGGQPMLENVTGTEIMWKEGNDLCFCEVMKKQRSKSGKTKTVKKQQRVESFFHFFTPPTLPFEDQDLDESEEDRLMHFVDADFELGLEFRDKIVPYALLWFTGEAMGDEDDDDDDYIPGDDEEDDDDDDEDQSDDEDDDADGTGEKKEECKQQ